MGRKRIRARIAAWALVVVLLACGIAAQAQESIKVVVSIPPIKFFVDRIGGEYVETYVLVKPGQDPHTYAPTPKDIAAIEEAKMLVRTGVPFEDALIAKIAATRPELVIADLREGVTVARRGASEEPQGYTGDEHEAGRSEAMHAGNPDPHIWLDPIAVKAQLHTIAHTLKEIDPAHYSSFCPRAHGLMGELDALNAEIAKSLAPYKGRSVLVYHPAFGYFMDRYGIVQIAVEAEGKEPGPKGLAAVVDQAKARGAKTVFVQKQFPVRSAEAVAGAIGGKVVALDPLSEDYLANLRATAQAIADGFAEAK